ncbi:(Fe-S)-binding protein [Ignicoccus hospitalis]|uniref:4Fe-4S ferredoxin, iron-sulfur binding domain protein n=1 Tax=Ignicoccus hospitalis (strain KIN4/I / DSM 18386 / JCM 14125) TaxID=453591 RepID=A8AC93_IGNH4|nr:(Fe-S)-binding protein [Ignicoccus hospitalis]ABU82545.1 4Fe-4S ferredoxin, iron-sulfur binding domain protein [Ignicoccus hospitalis KIN4/I]HIH90710.1 (Fe-S)-binding protein [Desulfurococcaceae archaeon]
MSESMDFSRMMQMLMSQKTSIDEAIKKAMKKVDAVMIHYIEDCLNCGTCSPACPYFVAGPQYSPVNKAEELRKIYRREMTILGRLLGPLVGADKPKTEEDMKRLMDLVYACTNCGHCYYTCTVGIHSGTMIGLLKSILTEAGYVPTLLNLFEAIEVQNMHMKIPGLKKVWEDALKEAQEKYGEIEFDKPNVDVFFLSWLTDAMMMREGFIATIGILNKLKEAGLITWTTWREPLGIRSPISVVIGRSENAAAVMRRIVEYIEKIKPKYVVMMDGGFTYPTFRFTMYPTIVKILGKKPEWKVIHITELLAMLLREGKIAFKQVNEPITWHDPCQMGRHSRVFEPPRELLKAASKGYRDLPHNREMNYCCGGGGGIGCILREVRVMMGQLVGQEIRLPPDEEEFERRIEERLKLATRRKVDDIAKSGAKLVLTACPACIETIQRGINWHGKDYGIEDVQVKHISEYLVDKLIAPAPSKPAH